MSPRVLVVDHDASQRRCVAAGLRVEGFEVIEALGGQEALEAVERYPVQVAVVDLMMPGMNGLEFCRRLKERAPGVAVLLTSVYCLSQRQLDLAGIGHATFLAKPFTLGRLVGAVRRHTATSLSPHPPV